VIRREFVRLSFLTSASSSRRRDIFDHVPNILPAYQIAPPWRPAIDIGKKAGALRQPFQNVGGRCQAGGVFCIKGGRSLFDVDLIVLKKVVVYIRREIGAVRGLAEEGEWEEVMRVYSRVRNGLIRQ
jgi:hypothetical protein